MGLPDAALPRRTEKPNVEGFRSISILINVPLPTPEGPQTTIAGGGAMTIRFDANRKERNRMPIDRRLSLFGGFFFGAADDSYERGHGENE